MYSTCIFCHSSLGRNDAVENFPVGRKLAFDANKGRLWAVCRKCGRWNLTPIEERWEAIEECERLFRGTIIRASTDQIGLAKIREGTDLIRIGDPLRPEFAAWRYTKFFTRRRNLVYGAIGASVVVGGAGLAAGMTLIGMVPTLASVAAKLVTNRTEIGRARRVLVEHTSKGLGKEIKKHESVDIRLIPSGEPQRWGLRLVHDGKFLDHHGWDATHLAHLIAPALNFDGAGKREVNEAVNEIERAGSPTVYFDRLVKYSYEKGWKFTGLPGYPREMRLAFEMAAHEETERAAIEEDLARLEADWRYAEEIASIADNLLVPHQISTLLQRLRS